MKIERVELQEILMPLKSPFVTSFGTQEKKVITIVRLHSEGKVGIAESVALAFPFYNEETNGTIWNIMEEFLIPILLENEISHPDDVSSLFSHIRRNNMAKAVLESAVWDLYSRTNNQSLSTALGGSFKEIDVGVSIGIESSIEQLLTVVGQFLNEGYKKIKVKIKPGWDVEPIKAIREKYGYDVPLMADANSAYTLQDIDLLKELDRYKLIMIEQPLAHDDIIDHAKLQAQISTSICLDESIHSLEDARKAIELGSCKIINIKVGRVGGLTAAKQIHDYCASKNIPVWCGGMLEAGVGRAHNIAIASLHNFSIPGDTSASNRYWNEDIVVPEVTTIRPGVIEVPKGEGIGFELNEQVIRKYLTREVSFGAKSKLGEEEAV
ncbi:o-succinylbenzoate synthase [Chryseomicrobium imtechense]